MPVLTSFYETNPDAELAIYPVVTEDDTAADGITVTPAYRSNNPFGMMVGFSSSATEDELKAAWMYLEWMCNDDEVCLCCLAIDQVILWICNSVIVILVCSL